MNKAEAIANILKAKAQPDLAELFSIDMECQVNVMQLDGERINGTYLGKEWSGFSDGISTWKPFRIPWNAMHKPEYTDSRITFDLEKYVLGIGMTGWDWQNLCSRWLAYDFDAMMGHSEKHLAKLSHDELQAIQDAACELPYVTVRKSSSGNGLHLYVAVDQVETANHHEHAALARAVLSQMSVDAGYDFVKSVDICGGNMWVYHRKGEGNPEAFKLIKEGDILEQVPTNWRDHIQVSKGHRKSVLHPQLTRAEDEFDLLVGRNVKVKLDGTHKELISWLKEQGAVHAWDGDNNMLVTHTWWLQKAQQNFDYIGRFQTDSKGTDLHEQNCFCFPLSGGAWSVRRFSKGCSEYASWEQDAGGWTKTYLNREPDLRTAARVYNAVEDAKGAFNFDEAETAITALRLLGIATDIDPTLNGSNAKINTHKDGRIVMTISDGNPKSSKMLGWHHDKNKYTKIFSVKAAGLDDQKGQLYDNSIRFLIETNNGYTEMGWFFMHEETKNWVSVSASSMKLMLKHLGLKAAEVDEAMGASISRPWVNVVEPFQEEYPGHRQWNRMGARLKYIPTTKDEYTHPTWDLVLEHLGKDIASSVKTNTWCENNGITSGADYLRVWIACLFQKPKSPLPYLFFYSPEQNTGKSTLSDALSMLMTRGAVRAANCLNPQNAFNAELDGAVLCIVEEVELDRSPKVQGRLKDWVTSPELGIHPKGFTPYSTINTTHWIHTANTHTACPVFAGDTRIVVISVSPFTSKEEIPKDELMHRLGEEAADFLGYVLGIPLSKPEGRLAIPCISTHQKTALTSSNTSALSLFLNTMCEAKDGYAIQGKAFVVAFHEWLADDDEAIEWSSTRVYKELPPKHPKGYAPFGGGNHIINLTLIEEHGLPILEKDIKKVADTILHVKDGVIIHE